MVRVHLSRLMGEKKLKIADVARATEINRGTITRLYHESAVRIDFDVLEKLCTYMDCSVADMVEVMPDDEA